MKNTSIRAVIVEDEELIGKELKRKLAETSHNIEVVEIIPSLKVARNWLMKNPEPNLWFMDVQLSDGISFKLFEEFNLSMPVIFTTAYNEYAINAFKVNGIDYLLKPVQNSDLENALEKYKKYHNGVLTYTPVAPFFVENLEAFRQAVFPPKQYKQKFLVHHRDQWYPVDTADIAGFEKNTLIYLYTFSGTRMVLSYETLEEIENLIDPDTFYRANR